MSSITISLIVFSSVFGGALLGILLHAVLPQHHLSSETKDIVKLGMGLVGTMAALVLGLLVASATVICLLGSTSFLRFTAEESAHKEGPLANQQ